MGALKTVRLLMFTIQQRHLNCALILQMEGSTVMPGLVLMSVTLEMMHSESLSKIVMIVSSAALAEFKLSLITVTLMDCVSLESLRQTE